MSNIDPMIEAITPKTKWFVVLRPFGGDAGKRFVRGEVVDVSDWIHYKRLVDNRYIMALPHGSEVPKQDKIGERHIVLTDEQTESVPAKKRPIPSRKEEH